MTKKVAIIILLGLAVLIILLTGMVLFVSKSQSPMTNAPANSDVQNQTQVKDETADWKTYKNDEYGFEFLYPTEVSIQESDNIVLINDNRHGYNFEWNMKFYKNNSREELREWINSQFDLFSQKSNKDCKIVPSDKYGLRLNIKESYTVLIDAPSYGGSCDHVGYYTISPNSLTIMEFDSVQASPELYQDILSTFKFTK